MYEGDNPENTLEDWSVAWGFRIDNNGGNQDVTVSSTDGNDYLISSDSNNLDIGNFVNTKAIKFSYFDNNKLKEEEKNNQESDKEREQKKEEDKKILKDTEKDENIFRNIILLGTIIALLVHIYKYIKFER